jgi:hypothetical protein
MPQQTINARVNRNDRIKHAGLRVGIETEENLRE